MYERLYPHSGILTEDGRTICPLCYAELNEDLMSPEPCIYDTASLVKYDGCGGSSTSRAVRRNSALPKTSSAISGTER